MSEEREMERGDGEKGKDVCNKQWREKVVVAGGREWSERKEEKGERRGGGSKKVENFSHN